MTKKKIRRRIRPISVFMLVALVLSACAYGSEWVKLQELQDKQTYYAAVYEGLQTENTELLETIELLEDETYMERLARERCKLIKPNEYLLLPVETNTDVEEYAGVDVTNLH